MSHIRLSRVILFAALAMAMILPASAAARVRFGVGVGFYGYPYAYGPWGYPYYGYVPYGPYGYAPYGYGYGYGYGRPLGEVHIKSPNPDAQIYINGAYAGRAHDLKTVYLVPGTYNIEQRIGSDVQKERLYVLANRSLRLEFDKPGTHPIPPPDADHQPGPPPEEPDADSAPQPAPQPKAPRQY